MRDKYKTLLKDTIIFAIGSVGTKIILFFLVPLYTNYLTTGEYGTADIVVNCATLINYVVSLSICQGVIRFVMANEYRKEDIVKTAFVFLLGSSVVTFLITAASKLYPLLSPWSNCLFIIVVLQFITDTEFFYLKAKNLNRKYVAISLIQTLTLAGTNILLLRNMRMGVEGYLMANIVSVGVAAVISFFVSELNRDIPQGHFSYQILKKLVIFSFPIAVCGIFWWLVQFADRFIVENQLGVDSLGLYTAAVKIPALINIVSTVFNQAWQLSSIREVDSGNDISFFSHVLLYLHMTLIGLAIFLTSIIKIFSKLYFGADFYEAWKYGVFLLVSSVFYAIGLYYESIFVAIRKTFDAMISMGACAASDVFLCILLIPRYGLGGAVVAQMMSYIVFSTVSMLVMKQYMQIHIDFIRLMLGVLLIVCEAFAVVRGLLTLPSIVAIFGIYVALYYSKIAELLSALKKICKRYIG